MSGFCKGLLFSEEENINGIMKVSMTLINGAHNRCHRFKITQCDCLFTENLQNLAVL